MASEKGANIMKVGYVRVSTRDQNTARQDVLMEQLGVEKIFTDKASGKTQDRPQLQEMMSFLREGDILTVESISRIARNTKDLLEITGQLKQKHVKFISQKERLDTDTVSGKFMLTIFGACAEMERDYILERQAEGIAIAKAEGRYNGRPPKQLDDFEDVYSAWKSGKLTATAATKRLGIARSTFYRRAERFEREEILDFG